MFRRRPDSISPLSNRELWRLYMLLVLANELDLALTYMGLAAGTFVEANPLMAPLLDTSWPVIMKLIPLAGLALALYAVVEAAPLRRRWAHGAISLAAAVYALVLMAHALNILLTQRPG